jgi:type VI secretion system protein ImpM
MSMADGSLTATEGFAWFGKLPCAGDFVSRRMPYALQQFWDQWLGAGMDALKAMARPSGWAFWGGTPHWAFLLPAQSGLPFAQLGLWAPSCDRVGRNFPFLLTTVLTAEMAPQLLPRAGTLALTWSETIRHVQRSAQSVEHADAAFAAALAAELDEEPPSSDTSTTLPRGANPLSLPWPGLMQSFDAGGEESYWWSVPPATTGFRARSFSGWLNSGVFLALCG